MKRKIIIILGVIILLIFIGLLIYSQVVPRLGSVPLAAEKSTTFPLIKNNSDAREGNISISQTEKGLTIKGTIKGEKPRWAEKPTDDMALFDHVELWVADEHDPKLPPIGWGNQFENPVLNSEKECDSNGDSSIISLSDPVQCKKWYEEQAGFQKQFSKLFVRQWQMSPNIVTETYATPVYDAFPSYIQENLKQLKPTTAPTIKISDKPNGEDAYDFQIDLPWSALPPIQSLELSDTKILVDIFNPGTGHLQYGSYSSIAGGHPFGDTSIFKDFTFPEPRQYSITSCKYDLGDNNSMTGPVFSEVAKAYIQPGDNLDLDKTIMVDNTIQGYQYEPYPSSTSPTIYQLDYFEKNIQPGETVCGPDLAYVKDSKIIKTGRSLATSSIEVKHLSDNEILVKSEPSVFYSYYGSGQCGACARGAISIDYIDFKNATSVPAYSFLSVFDENDADFQISEDWKKLVEYYYGPPEDAENPYDSSMYRWSSTNQCFNNQSHVYDECGKNDKASPPNPRNFTAGYHDY